MAAFLEAVDISKIFDGVQALAKVSVSIDAGEIHCLVGENGSGKSTLIKIIGGVLKPNSGQLRVNGAVFSPARAERNLFHCTLLALSHTDDRV